MSDDLVFEDEVPDTDAPRRPAQAPWHILIVDDEPAVHEVTKLVMTGFEMDGRPLEFLHCYSAREARVVLAARDDIALILLDVVMETEHAGLD
jgi:CheY-like chemotaxis protein